MKVEIEESKLQTAYANACDGVKDFMESLFGKKVFEAAKPTLDDYKTIRTYEDACVALKQDAIRVDSVNRDTTTVLTNGGDRVNMPSHIVALMTLGSACAKKQKKRLSISGSNSLNFGLNI